MFSNMTIDCFNGVCIPMQIPIYLCKKFLTNNEILALFIGLICSYFIGDYLSEIICEKIEARQSKMHAMLTQDLKYRDAEIQSVLKENTRLKEELDHLKALSAKEKNETKKLRTTDGSPRQKIIQCDKCYNEYAAENIKTSYIVQNIKQQYCTECFYRVTDIKKSKSDSHFSYIN